MSELYPVKVRFVDGESPTARKLNRWETQIDSAFTTLERVLGLTGDDTQLTYIANVALTLGNIGWIDSRLPANLADGMAEDNLPTVKQVLDSEGKKTSSLTFFPKKALGLPLLPDWAFDGVSHDWARQSSLSNLVGGRERFMVVDRTITTSSPIGSDAYIEYVVDPKHSYDSFKDDSGSNLVPNLFQIALDTGLCEWSEVDSEFFINFPEITRCYNPRAPFSLSSDDVLDLRYNESGSIRWSSLATTPKYTVPDRIWSIAGGANSQIPEGLVSLWCRSGDSISQVVGSDPLDPIVFFTGSNKQKVKIVLPPDLALAMPHMIDEALVNQYILAFAGSPVSEALHHERARSIHHKHDGSDDGELLSAINLKDRFDETIYTVSKSTSNPFPQYLLRSGYEEGSDPLNLDNKMWGDLVLGPAGTTPIEDSAGPLSHKLWFYNLETGPSVYFDTTDDEPGTIGLPIETEGKLILKGRTLRLSEKEIFLGEGGASIALSSSAGSPVFQLYIVKAGGAPLYECEIVTGGLSLFGGSGLGNKIHFSGDEGQSIFATNRNDDEISDLSDAIVIDKLLGGSEEYLKISSNIKAKNLLTKQLLVSDRIHTRAVVDSTETNEGEPSPESWDISIPLHGQNFVTTLFPSDMIWSQADWNYSVDGDRLGLTNFGDLDSFVCGVFESPETKGSQFIDRGETPSDECYLLKLWIQTSGGDDRNLSVEVFRLENDGTKVTLLERDITIADAPTQHLVYDVGGTLGDDVTEEPSKFKAQSERIGIRFWGPSGMTILSAKALIRTIYLS